MSSQVYVKKNIDILLALSKVIARHLKTMNKQIIIALLSLGIVAFCEAKELSELLHEEKFVERIKDCILDKETCDEMGFKVRSKIYFTFTRFYDHIFLIFYIYIHLYNYAGVFIYIYYFVYTHDIYLTANTNL